MCSMKTTNTYQDEPQGLETNSLAKERTFFPPLRWIRMLFFIHIEQKLSDIQAAGGRILGTRVCSAAGSFSIIV